MSDKLAPLYWCCVTPALRRDASRREILLSVECGSPDPPSPRRDHTELGSGQRISPIGRQGPLDHQDDHVSKHSSRCQSSMLPQDDDEYQTLGRWLYHLATWLEGAEPPSASSCALHPRLARSQITRLAQKCLLQSRGRGGSARARIEKKFMIGVAKRRCLRVPHFRIEGPSDPKEGPRGSLIACVRGVAAQR